MKQQNCVAIYTVKIDDHLATLYDRVRVTQGVKMLAV